jgi:hypothetical protein
MTLPPDVRAALTRALVQAGDAHRGLLMVPSLANQHDQDAISMARKALAHIGLELQQILANNENPGGHRG